MYSDRLIPGLGLVSLFKFGFLSFNGFSFCLQSLLKYEIQDTINGPRHEKKRLFVYAKTKTQICFAVTAKQISAFVFAT